MASASKIGSVSQGSIKRAVIDIGSNTVRLVVYGGCARAPDILHNEKVSARLGKGVGDTGRISRKSASLALNSLARYRQLLNFMQVDRVDVVATAAARDAANGQEFLDQVKALGFDPRLLSGEEEALISAQGVAWAFAGANGIVADLGGGSLELTEISGHHCSHGVSLPLGSLRLQAMRAKGPAFFRRSVSDLLDKADWTAEPGATLYLVGGSLRAFARHAIARDKLLIDDPHGFTMTATSALKLARSIVRRPPANPAMLTGISGSRAASLPDTAALLSALIAHLKTEKLVFSAWGLREGILFNNAPPQLREADPLLASVTAFATARGVEREHIENVVSWTSGILSDNAVQSARLHHAAVVLCLTSTRIEPHLRASLARDWALRKRWLGLSPDERHLLAIAIRANANMTDLLPEPVGVREDLRNLARTWGLTVRLCRRFSGLAPRVMALSNLQIADAKLVLQVREEIAALVDENTRKDLKALGQHLGIQSLVSIQRP